MEKANIEKCGRLMARKKVLDRRLKTIEALKVAVVNEKSALVREINEEGRKVIEKQMFWANEDRTSVCMVTKLNASSRMRVARKEDIIIKYARQGHMYDLEMCSNPYGLLESWPVPISKEEYRKLKDKITGETPDIERYKV